MASLTRTYETRQGSRPIYENRGGGEGGDIAQVGTQDYDYQYFTGWTDQSGNFYSGGDDFTLVGLNYSAAQGVNNGQLENSPYFWQRQQVVQQEAWDRELTTERQRIEADQAAQRAQWQAQLQAQTDEFNRQTAEAQRAAEEQSRQFEADRVSREQAKVAAEKAKQEKLAGEARISAGTVLGDMQRVAAVKENDLVAVEDKTALTADAKDKMFSATKTEEEQQQVKQSFLEQIMSGGVTGAPKQ